jgi:hypothetical protein
MSIAEKLATIAENQQKVYDAGKQAEYDAFWDEVQNYGNRRKYQITFNGEGLIWTDKTYNPKYPIICEKTGYYDAYRTFYQNRDITDIKVPIILNGADFYETFRGASAVKRIPSVTLNNVTRILYAFYACSSLEELSIYGLIEVNGFDVTDCTKLTRDSLMSIINALADKSTDTSGTSWVCTLGATNLGKLTNEEKAIATEKGWTLA